MGKPDFSDEFKRDAVAQIVERGYPAAEVLRQLGVSQHSLYAWKRQLAGQVSGDTSKDAEIRQLKCALARGTEERDILKSHRVFRQGCKVRYAFIAEHRDRFWSLAMPMSRSTQRIFTCQRVSLTRKHRKFASPGQIHSIWM